MAVISAPICVCASVKEQNKRRAKIQGKDITHKQRFTRIIRLILYYSLYPNIVNGKTENIYKLERFNLTRSTILIFF